LKVEGWEFDKEKVFKVFETSKSPRLSRFFCGRGFRGLWGCKLHLSFQHLFGLFAAIFFCLKGRQKKDFRFYPAAVEQKIFIQLLPKRRLTRRLKRRLKRIKKRKILCDLAPLRALRETKNVAHFAIFA
jgi:hypothetical protein